MIAAAALLLLGRFPGGIRAADADPPPAARAAAPAILADLPPEVRIALREHGLRPEELDAQSLLDAVVQVAPPYEFSAGALAARTDVRWFSTLPAEGPGTPLLELRRWPGDSVLALYDVAPPATGTEPPPAPGWPGTAWSAVEGTGAGVGVWEGTLGTAVGDRPALWIVRRVVEAGPWLGALLMPGDAGLGPAGTESITEEMLAILRRVEVHEAAWKSRSGIPAGKLPAVPLTVEVPGAASEDHAPWQVARAAGFTIGLPPGVRARAMGGDVPAPHGLAGGRLWLRGRFVDTAGVAVTIGDPERFGYVARVEPAGEDWGERAPLLAPGASRLASETFPLAAERTGASKATAERWSEPGFDGQWIVFRLHFDGHGYEVGLPVVEGRRSSSLFWIPATWRDERKPPSPPPVDPAERFGIRFERLGRADRGKQPWLEGHLTTPGLTAEVSRGFNPAASLRSEDGYPVRFLTEQGVTVGILARLPAATVSQTTAGREGLSELDKPARHRASKVLHDAGDNYLFVSAGSGDGFLFEFSPPAAASAKEIQGWRELWLLMIRSVRLRG